MRRQLNVSERPLRRIFAIVAKFNISIEKKLLHSWKLCFCFVHFLNWIRTNKRVELDCFLFCSIMAGYLQIELCNIIRYRMAFFQIVNSEVNTKFCPHLFSKGLMNCLVWIEKVLWNRLWARACANSVNIYRSVAYYKPLGFIRCRLTELDH